MKVQIVHARVPDGARERYLEAWGEWSGTLYPMGIESRLVEREGEPGRFLELTFFEPGEEAAAGDDRLVAADREMQAAADRREGAHEFWSEVVSPGGSGT